jgi:FkbM family methyltransferase
VVNSKVSEVRVEARSLCKRAFHALLERLGIRRLREHSFFASLLPKEAIVADLGAHRGEFLAGLKSEYSISRAILVEANPALAESLKQTFSEADVVHAALVGGDSEGPIRFTRSIQPEASSVFREWAAVYGFEDEVEVPVVKFATIIRTLGGRVDLVKFDIEGAEIEILKEARASDLNSCAQFTVEFHDKQPIGTRQAVEDVCRRMRSEGHLIVKPNWPKVDDVLFINLNRMRPMKRIEVRWRVALANALFFVRRRIFASGYS